MTPGFSRALLGAATLSLALIGGGARAQDATPAAEPVLQVTGEGRVSTVPDMATIRLGVVAEAVTPGQAVDAMSTPMAALIEQILARGIDPRDVQTSELRLRPVYSQTERLPGQGREITGYEAASDVSVTVRALDALGAILDEAVGAGSNRFDGLSFGMSDPTPVRDAALTSAMADALRKAGVLAAAAGLRLGPVLEVTEQGGTLQPAPMMMEAAMDRSVPVAPGAVDTQALILVRFGLLE